MRNTSRGDGICQYAPTLRLGDGVHAAHRADAPAAEGWTRRRRLYPVHFEVGVCTHHCIFVAHALKLARYPFTTIHDEVLTSKSTRGRSGSNGLTAACTLSRHCEVQSER